jgi:uncharacterized protein (TIGR02246 family)
MTLQRAFGVAAAAPLAAALLWTLATTNARAGRNSDDPVAVGAALMERLQAAWNGGGNAPSFTEDVDFINGFGPYWRGADKVAKGTESIKATYDSEASYKLLHASEIAPGVVLVIANATATIPAGQPLAGVHPTTQSVLLVKRGTDWKIRFLQTTPVVATQPVGTP